MLGLQLISVFSEPSTATREPRGLQKGSAIGRLRYKPVRLQTVSAFCRPSEILQKLDVR